MRAEPSARSSSAMRGGLGARPAMADGYAQQHDAFTCSLCKHEGRVRRCHDRCRLRLLDSPRATARDEPARRAHPAATRACGGQCPSTQPSRCWRPAQPGTARRRAFLGCPTTQGQHGQACLSCPCGSVLPPPVRLRHRGQPSSHSRPFRASQQVTATGPKENGSLMVWHQPATFLWRTSEGRPTCRSCCRRACRRLPHREVLVNRILPRPQSACAFLMGHHPISGPPPY